MWLIVNMLAAFGELLQCHTLNNVGNFEGSPKIENTNRTTIELGTLQWIHDWRACGQQFDF